MSVLIRIVSIALSSFLYSFITSLLIMFGIEESGGDPGTPAIMLVGFLIICMFLGILTASIMSNAKEKRNKAFPVKISLPAFITMYAFGHIFAIYFPTVAFLGNLSAILLFVSYVPFYHVFSQSLLNGYAFIKERRLKTDH